MALTGNDLKDENAVNLVYAFLGLQDNFDLEGFSEKRQGAMNALVSCAPRKAPPSVFLPCHLDFQII